MAPLSLKIILDEASVTKTLLFDTRTTVSQVHEIVKDRIVSLNPDKEYGFFLTSADDECSGVWLENHRTLEYYMLREGDSLYYLERMRNLRLRMLDGSVKTLQVDESKAIGELMSYICDKIGTTNYEEYGLCREHMEIEDEIKPMTGTLTLKRKAQAREKDAKLEQLSKKLKTDDNVEWLDQHKTLRELRVEPKETLLFKRRLFYSDRKVDSRDPVQLNLLYVQTRDAILDGRQIVTEEKAIEFAGLQCQIHFEDFSEEKHKPGFIENLREFLPGQYATSWGIEKKIFKEHRKHQGLSPLEAKNLYTKTARELPTYGVTFFLVKEKHKGKKKLIPRLLGINSSSVLRLDEETKEILQVWPLTQVKSYRAASESFTLDFGDYSEKEYAVKTNEAFRIKDILQGYIDIIRKKLAAPYNPVHTEGDVICEDNVEILRGTIIQNIIPSKIVEQSFVGPSSIISVQQGHRSSEGTTITTIHEVVTVTRGDMSQQGLKGEALGEPPNVFGKRLNRINSLSVKTVVLLSDGNEDGYGNLSNIVSDMENELPAIVKGVRDTAKNLNDEKSKKLLDELDELCDYINNLSNIAKSSDYDNDKLESANEIAKKLADISAQMYLSLDPKSKKRSQLINSSRNSFIADEQTEANLRRMSLRTVVETTHEVLDSCYYDLDQEYNATGAEPVIYSTLEKSVNNKLGKLNAAIASLIIAHSDPNEVNYSTAVTCMSTIKEIMPELVQDIKTLNSLNDDVEGRLALTDEIKKLIDRTAALCRLNGTDDPQKLQEAGNAFGEISRKLIYKFNRGNKMNQIADKENQILDLAEEVGESASNLLIEISELNNMITDDPRSEELDTAGVKCADAARELYECAKLTGPSIHEPHCQSALTGACEHLTSSVQHLIQTYKPIVDDPGRHYYGKRLANKVTDVNKALDKLMNAYANLNEAENSTDESSDGNVKKLQFTLSRARKALGEMEDQLLDDTDLTTLTAYDGTPYNANIQKLESKLSQKISQLNAAVATLLQATSSEKPDYGKVNDAVDVISQMTPEIIQDSKILEAHLHELRGGDETSKQKLLHHLKDLLNATKDVCSSADDDNKIDLNAAASKLAKSTKKLQWMYNPLTNANREYLVMEQAKEVGNKTSELLMDTSELVTSVGDDPRAEDLEVAGVRCADAAKGLITCAELTSPTIENTTSKSALAASCGTLESALQILNDTYKPIVSEPERYYYGNTLAARNDNLVKALDKLKNLCGGDGTSDADELPESQKAQKLKFVNSLSRCNDALKDAEYKLNDPSLVINNNVQSEADRDNLQTELSKKMSKLNAAIAQLLNSISGIPDYEKTNSAIDTIAQLTPGIIYDVRSLEAHGNGDEQKILRQNLQHILDATRDICNTEHDNKSLGDAVEKYAQSSGKLNFVLNRHAKPNNENQTMELARDVGDQTSVLLYQTRGLIGENDEFKPEHLKLNEAIVACTYAAKELETSAQVTAPFLYESSCQEALANAAKNLADKLEDLALAYKPFLQGPGQTMNRQTIVKKTMGVIEALDKLKAHATSQPEETKLVQNTFKEEGPKRLFKASLTESKNTLSDAIKLLERDDYVLKPFQKVVCDPSTSPKAYMSQNLAQLNASIASLLHATTDAPDYDAATSAIAVIPTLIPNIVKAGECIHGENPSENITAKITPLLMTIQEICKSADEGRHKDLNDNTMEFADQSEKIFIECNPHTNERKKSRILDLSKGACKDASIYLTKVYQLAQKVGADEATDLDVFGSKIVDTAQVLLTAAQVTAPTMEDLQCQNVLISFTDTFSKKIDDLDNMWAPLIGPHNEDLGDQMKSDSNTLRKTLTELRNICVSSSDDEDKEQLQSKVLGANDKLKAIEKLASKERLRELPEPPLLEFVSIMTKDQGCIEKTTIEPTKYLLCERLSQLNQSIALLLQTMSGRDRVDHKVHEELVQNISEMAPETIKYILSTHKYLEDDVQKEMIAEVKNLCESTQGILSSVGTENNEELSDAVSKYGYSTGKLYFIFSPYKKAERKKEAEIVQTARSACERTSLMLSRVSRLAQTLDASKAEPLDCTGVELADAAQALLTNAQLTSPSIRFECSQSVLAASVNKVNQLSSELGDAWSPLVSTDEQLCQQLDKDLMHLHTDLNKLKDIILESNQWIPLPDLETDENTIKKIDTESKHDKDLSIEDTPLKDLASKILNSAKIMLESGNLTKEKHSVLKSFTNELTAALCALDLATARCKRDPMDAKKRQDLENVIQNVQHLCLVGQKEADSQTNIIDLMLFVKDVVTAANDLYQSTESVQSPSSKQALMTIRDACDDIIVKAESLSNPPDITDDALHDMLITEQFAQECDARVEIIQDSVADMSDSSSRNLLEEKLRCLIEKCNLLKFAAKGSVSSAFGLAIDEDLQKLVDAEKKIQLLLTINDQNKTTDYDKPMDIEAVKTAQKPFRYAVIAKQDNVPQALAQYAMRMIAATPRDAASQLKLKEHLNKLTNLLKKRNLASGRRVATWQDADADDVTDTTNQILQEIHGYISEDKTSYRSDLQALMTSNESVIDCDINELNSKLSQQTQKLSFMIGTVILNSDKPDGIAQAVHSTEKVVAEISALTKAIKNKDVIQGKKMEKATNYLIASMYNLHETSESISQEYEKPESRRKLLDACRTLTDALNKFAQASSRAGKVKADGDESLLNIQLEQVLLSPNLPTCALGLEDTLDALQAQGEIIQKLESEETTRHSEWGNTLRYAAAAACAGAQYSSHSAYLLSIAEDNADAAKKGLIDHIRFDQLSNNVDDVCSKIISGDKEQTKSLEPVLSKHIQQLSEFVDDCTVKLNEVESEKVKEDYRVINSVMDELKDEMNASPYRDDLVISRSFKLLDAINRLKTTIKRLPTPRYNPSTSEKHNLGVIMENAKKLLNETSGLVSQVTSSDDDLVTWLMGVELSGKQVIKAYEAILTCIRNKGKEMKLLQSSDVSNDDQEPPKSHLQTQMDLINKWLRNPACKQDVKNDAIRAAHNIIDMGDKMSEDLKDTEKDEMFHVVVESKELLKECSVKYQSDKASLLLERLRDLKGMLERGVVTRVVEEFLEEQPLEDMENIRKETDVKRRDLLLDKKIAELLAQLGRVSRTAKFVSDTTASPIRHDIIHSSEQVELLAPSLVKSAQESVRNQDDQAIENYHEMVMKYAESLNRVRELCDRAVNPMDFAQAAVETMARIKEVSKNDPIKATYAASIITRLGNRVVEAGMSSVNVQKDPELQQTLASIKKSITEAHHTKTDLATEIIRKTGEVESALGGENIFQKEPEADQPIFAAAHGLHAAVRDWSARDNEVVAVAKRVAVLMARLAHHMYNDRKAELILTSKEIVAKSHEVAALARKLAMECSDLRIRNNLLQVCQRIPLISGQLKMLTTVKGSTLGKQGSEEDMEAMNMLVGNAQNLMTSIQEIVKVAESASVKIMSQRGRKIRWVRRNYY